MNFLTTAYHNMRGLCDSNFSGVYQSAEDQGEDDLVEASPTTKKAGAIALSLLIFSPFGAMGGDPHKRLHVRSFRPSRSSHYNSNNSFWGADFDLWSMCCQNILYKLYQRTTPNPRSDKPKYYPKRQL